MDSAPASNARTPQLEAAIRRRAQQLYEQRGCLPGHQVEDWLQAEAEVTREFGASPAQKPAFIVVRFAGVTYTGEYDREHCDGYAPGEFSPSASLEVRIDRDQMFLRRPNGKELQTRIVRRST